MLTEMTILMLTLMGEASICSEGEMRAVARVIQVRAEDRKMTIRQVCLQPKQFSCWNGPKAKRKMLGVVWSETTRRSPAWRLTIRVALDLYAKQLNTLPQWNHYYNPALCMPEWAGKLTQTRVVGHHVFGRIDK
jgi:hypothetical protein